MNLIRTYRENRGLSQAEFAELIGATQAAISNYENGIRLPNWKTAKELDRISDGALSVHDLRPDIFGPPPAASEQEVA